MNSSRTKHKRDAQFELSTANNASERSSVSRAAHRPIGPVRKVASYGLLAFGISCIFVLDQTDVVMNASRSLDEPAYLMLEHPFWLSRGTVVSAEMPEVLAAKFGDMHFVKRIGGLPGDVIWLDDAGTPCIEEKCFPVFERNGLPVSSPIKPGVIPQGHYAVFGTSDDSLDSRYAVIGLIAEDELLGRGWPIMFASDWRSPNDAE